jgi:hypothetical protein
LDWSKGVGDDAAVTPLKNETVRHEGDAELVTGGDDSGVGEADDLDRDEGRV